VEQLVLSDTPLIMFMFNNNNR